MVEPSPRRTALRGFLSMLIAVSLFSAMSALGKAATEIYPITEVVFFRNALAVIPPVLVLTASQRWGQLRTKRLKGHLGRAVIGFVSMSLTFWSFHLLPLADATALSFSSPLFLTALSVPILHEKVGPHRWGAVLVGFLGVIVLAKPSGDVLNMGFLVAMAASLGVAFAAMTLRQLGRTEPAVVTVFYFGVFATLFSTLSLPFGWATPDWRGLALLAAVGLIGGTAQQFMTSAYAALPAAALGPFNYIGIVWASLFGWLFWSDLPSMHVVAGALIVIASGLYILWREVVRAREAGLEPKPLSTLAATAPSSMPGAEE